MATIEAMSTSQTMTNVTRNLPTSLTGEVERLGYSILRSLDRLGFVHANQDGGMFTIRFDAVRLYGETWAAYHVDAERLYHFSVSDLAKRDVLAQLSAVTRKPVRAFDDGGLAYVVELQPKPKVSLPDNVTLDLGQRPDGELLVPLGVGRDGATWRALPKLGHALIVGTTGAGKSTWLHAALAALLTSARPDQLRLALIDPKRSEFTAWAGAPHLVGEIAHDETQATKLLADLVQEVDRRGDLFGAAVCRDIVTYNKAVLSPQAADPLPYILIAIDECLDLVLSAGNKSDLASYLKTIAIRGRSAGVILWAATQHAAAVTGMPRVVNVNLSARLVFRVADQSAAQIAGCPGAENLSRDKPGRLLAKIDGKPVELQAYHLPDDDLAKITRAIAGSKPSGPTLTTTEAALATWAIESNGGVLTLSDIRTRANVGQREARRLAESWERRGWLVKDAQSKNRRRVSDDLRGRVSGQKVDKLTNTTN
jgi:hypothetical protein